VTGPSVQTGKRAIYPAYKPSGMDWVGDVPEHWEVRRLKYTATINDEALAETTDPDYEFTYVDIGSVDASKGIVATETYRFQDAPSRARRIVRDGDTIVSTVRTYLRAIAPIQGADGSLIVSTGFAVVRPRSLDPGYLSYALRSPFFVETVVSRSTGVSYPAINSPEVGNIGITLPPLDEQKAIAAFLDRETARIDTLIEKKRRQIELLQEKRSALISHAVTKGLDPNAPMKDSGIEWLGDVPASWYHRKLGYVASMSGGCTPSKSNEAYWRGTIPWVSPKDMKKRCINDSEDHVSEEAVSDTGLRLLEPPVVLIVVRGMILAHTFPVGLTTAPVTINQDMKALRPERGVVADYLAFLLEGISSLVLSHVDESAHGTKCLRTDLWKNISVFIPDEQEQLEVCARLHQQMRKIDDLIMRVDESAAMLREHRIALISAAVTGKIDVRGEAA